MFYVTIGHLLGFIVSQRDITMDPLKVQAITEIPPPQNLRQLQSLQGKANFLRCFVPDYAIHAHGFLHLLCHDIPFHWDDYAQQSFDDLKTTLSNAPLTDAQHHHIRHLSIFLDSQLVVLQLNNVYCVHDPCLFRKYL